MRRIIILLLLSTIYGQVDSDFISPGDFVDRKPTLPEVVLPNFVEDKDVDLVLEDVVGGMTEGMNVDYTGDLSKDGYPGKAVSANDGEMVWQFLLRQLPIIKIEL